jgi:hypothetical protein
MRRKNPIHRGELREMKQGAKKASRRTHRRSERTQQRRRGKQRIEEQIEKQPPISPRRKKELQKRFAEAIESVEPYWLKAHAEEIEEGTWRRGYSYTKDFVRAGRVIGLSPMDVARRLREESLRREKAAAWRHRRAYSFVDWNKVVPAGDTPYWTDRDGNRHPRNFEYTWSAVFGEPQAGTAGARPGPFGRDHVAQVVKAVHIRVPPGDDYADDYYFALFRLVDGRWGYVEAWNDSTGWGCQDSNSYALADALDALIPQMSDRGRYHLGFESPLQRLSASFVD